MSCLKPSRSPRRQRGAGALIVVLVLFFIMALVAAYSSRNMIFEQKTSSNLYRSNQAFEAAEAGIEWALAMLNSGRIDADCKPVATGTSTTFRQRYLNIDSSDGMIAPRTYMSSGSPTPLTVLCAKDGAAWSCSCPDAGLPTLAAPSTDPAPGFRLRFISGGLRPGVVQLRSQGCTRLSNTCLNDFQTATGGDATASITSLVALKGALSTPPSAALTVRNGIDTTGAMRVVNTDVETSGITTHIGGADNNTAMIRQSLPGTASDASTVSNDGMLSSRDAPLMFSAYFGMADTLYQQQPGTIFLSCPSDCSAAALAAKAQLNPGRMLWLDGDVRLDSNADIGSPTSPVVMVVKGDLQSTALPRIFGLVYVIKTNWVTDGNLLIQGAAIASDTVSGAGTPAIVFDPDIVRRLRNDSGSFVRVPGGWKDFF